MGFSSEGYETGGNERSESGQKANHSIVLGSGEEGSGKEHVGKVQHKSLNQKEDLREIRGENSKERVVVEEERGENNLVSEGDNENQTELGGVGFVSELVKMPNLDEPGMDEVIVCGEAGDKNCGVDLDVMDVERDDSHRKDSNRELCELDQHIMRAEPEIYEGRGGIRRV